MSCKECIRLEEIAERAKRRLAQRPLLVNPLDPREEWELIALQANLTEAEAQAHRKSCEECQRGF
jgi:hypothetical protein